MPAAARCTDMPAHGSGCLCPRPGTNCTEACDQAFADGYRLSAWQMRSRPSLWCESGGHHLNAMLARAALHAAAMCRSTRQRCDVDDNTLRANSDPDHDRRPVGAAAASCGVPLRAVYGLPPTNAADLSPAPRSGTSSSCHEFRRVVCGGAGRLTPTDERADYECEIEVPRTEWPRRKPPIRIENTELALILAGAGGCAAPLVSPSQLPTVLTTGAINGLGTPGSGIASREIASSRLLAEQQRCSSRHPTVLLSPSLRRSRMAPTLATPWGVV